MYIQPDWQIDGQMKVVLLSGKASCRETHIIIFPEVQLSRNFSCFKERAYNIHKIINFGVLTHFFLAFSVHFVLLCVYNVGQKWLKMLQLCSIEGS